MISGNIDFSSIKGSESLPAAEMARTINLSLNEHDALVVTAPPGAGKSTLLPLTLLQGLGSEGKILMLEPRRLAARQIAERMSSMLGEKVGQTVGYRVRFESKVNEKTRIEVLTEGILTRMLADDPTLDGVSIVIFDEFHERNLASDVALALTRESQQIIRPDLRLLIMSATIDASAICQALSAQLVECQGRIHPVEIRYADIEPSMHNAQEIAEAVSHQVREAHKLNEGDILAFLPGEGEIRQCQALLQGALGATLICPLYGLLSPQEQQRAIAPSLPSERKVVLATPIAETSLTIEGVRVVVDSGLCRTMVFDAQSGLSRMQTVRISQDMADQRSGRAGRVSAGICYRLWSLATQHRMASCRTPEILDADLAPMILDIAAWGEGQAERLSWLTPPPAAHMAQARQLLLLLRAIDKDHKITAHGKKLAALPCHPRIAQMMLSAQSPTEGALAADIAALLEERDPLASDTAIGADINHRISLLRQKRERQNTDRQWERIARIAAQYAAMNHTKPDDKDFNPYVTGRLLASAYPERVAQNINAAIGQYRMASGEQAQTEQGDELTAYNWLSIASVNAGKGQGGKIFLASPVDPKELEEIIWVRENVSWDNKRGAVVAQSEKKIGCLLIETQPIHNISNNNILQVICQAAVKEGTSMFDFNDQVQNLQRRIEAVSQWHPELNLPDLSTEAVLLSADQWLPFYIGKASTANELRKIDLTQALWGLLDYNQQQEVDRLAPTHIKVPTGSRIRVEYRQGAELPILRVRLQECFGLTDTPRVDDGRRPVLMELLSPGFKPVQLTQDLRSFWQGTYFEVRKELRRRYPKHAWPDNPLEAEAVRGVKRSS